MQSQKRQNDLYRFRGKPFSITVFQVYVPKSNAEEAEVEQFYEDLKDILEFWVQSLSHVWLFATPWITARQATLSITNSRSSLRLTSVESVMPSKHLILCRPFLLRLQSFPASGSFQMSQFFSSGGLGIGASASASVLPMNIKDWFPLGLTGWISLKSKGLSRVFSNTTVQRHQFFGAQLSL